MKIRYIVLLASFVLLSVLLQAAKNPPPSLPGLPVASKTQISPAPKPVATLPSAPSKPVAMSSKISASDTPVAAEKKEVQHATKEISVDAYEREWDALKERLEEVDRKESDVLAQFKDLDNQIDRAVDESVDARKFVAEMLEVKGEEAASQNLKRLKESLEKIKKIEDDIKTKRIADIDKGLKSLETHMNEVNSKVAALQKQADVLELPTEELLEKKSQERTAQIKAKGQQKESEFFEKSVTFASFIMNFVKGFGNFVLQVFGSIGRWLEEVTGQDKESDVLPEVKKKVDEQNIIPEKNVGGQKSSRSKTTGKPEWQMIAERGFGNFLGFLTVFIVKVKDYGVLFYDHVVQGKLSKFVDAVKRRSTALEKSKKEEATAQNDDQAVDIGKPEEMGPLPRKAAPQPPTIPEPSVKKFPETGLPTLPGA